MKFAVTLTLIVEADSVTDAWDVGVGAGEHLVETFNDDDSISPAVRVEARPLKAPPALGDSAECKHCGKTLSFRGPIFGWRDAHSGRHCPGVGGPRTKHAPTEAP